MTFEHKKVIQQFILFHNRSLVFYFYDRFLIIRFYLDICFSTDRVPSQIKRFYCSPWDGDSLFSHVLVAEVFTCVLTFVLISANQVPSLFKLFFTLITFFFITLSFRFQSECKNLELIFVFLLE